MQAAGINTAASIKEKSWSRLDSSRVSSVRRKRRDASRRNDSAVFYTTDDGEEHPGLVHRIMTSDLSPLQYALVEPLAVKPPYWSGWQTDLPELDNLIRADAFMRHVLQVDRGDARICVPWARMTRKAMFLQNSYSSCFVVRIPNSVDYAL